MKPKILFLEIILAFVVAMSLRSLIVKEKQYISAPSSREEKMKSMLLCSPDWSEIDEDLLAASIGPLPGWGKYFWKIGSSNDSAQFYFNQGINMYYAFHIIEAMASFKKAETFDDKEPMIYWAQALAYGPNINDLEYNAAPEAADAAAKAVALSGKLSLKERLLINAMSKRYSKDTSVSRALLDEAYTRAMEDASNSTSDADVHALYADAIMLQHPWRYWKANGEAESWTPELIAILEKVLKNNPEHPGANHYYIHATEASPAPQRALASADRLGTMMPGVSHMVHMPSHVYIRSGHYEKGIEVNETAVKAYNKYLELYPEVVNKMDIYLIHNLHMQAACAMLRPNYGYALKSAELARKSFDTSFLSLPAPIGCFAQYVYITPQLVKLRFGRWADLAAEPVIPENYVYAHLLDSWARGMAAASSGKKEEAIKYLEAVNQSILHPDLKVVMGPFNAPKSGGLVAQKLLEGMISEKFGKQDDALNYYKQARLLEDSLIYTEPRDWLIPTRHYLANSLIAAGKFKEAETVLKEDLAINPNNFYALSALDKMSRQKQLNDKAGVHQKAFKQVFTGTDMPEGALVY